ncbi:MAG: helix-turn-helix domain-containing protein [Dehalococcoidia bacterium]|nr:helix-turn-helix domain-containing protein [Dehalococcoidia bacterium]
MAKKRSGRPEWRAPDIRALRRHLRMTQEQLAEEMGTRQQTISEWERELYRPRGASAKLLSLIAERAGFTYQAEGTERPEQAGEQQRPPTARRKRDRQG